MDLCEASKKADTNTINFLLSCGEEVNKKKTIFGTFPLLEAVKAYEKEKNIEPVRTLVLSGADINEQDTNGWTVLHYACERGLKEVLEVLLGLWEQGKCGRIQLNRPTNKAYHMLHVAALNNHPDVIALLAGSPAAKKLQLNLWAVDGDKCTMLHHAARKGSLEALKKILEISKDLLYEVDKGGNSALHYAAANSFFLSI